MVEHRRFVVVGIQIAVSQGYFTHINQMSNLDVFYFGPKDGCRATDESWRLNLDVVQYETSQRGNIGRDASGLLSVALVCK